MVQRGQHFGFPLEAGQPVRVGRERLGQHLERHVPVERGVASLIHLAHTALTNQANDFVRAERRTGV